MYDARLPRVRPYCRRRLSILGPYRESPVLDRDGYNMVEDARKNRFLFMAPMRKFVVSAEERSVASPASDELLIARRKKKKEEGPASTQYVWNITTTPNIFCLRRSYFLNFGRTVIRHLPRLISSQKKSGHCGTVLRDGIAGGRKAEREDHKI